MKQPKKLTKQVSKSKKNSTLYFGEPRRYLQEEIRKYFCTNYT